MTRVWTARFNIDCLVEAAEAVALEADSWPDRLPAWIDRCGETRAYVTSWFASRQRLTLSKLACVLAKRSGPVADALRIALSRIIVTKERGASIARDTSHSRPHRVFSDNDFDVRSGFLRSASVLAGKLYSERLRGSAVVNVGDARHMEHLPGNSIDAVITSPPYLNAIDYMRGHRLALVWLGFTVRDLRSVRSSSIGTEVSGVRRTEISPTAILQDAVDLILLPSRERGMITNYALDIHAFMSEVKRVVRRDGELIVVVADSCLKGVSISNAAINRSAAEMVGLRLQEIVKRDLPPAHRYLPPPSSVRTEPLAKRMKTESVMVFRPM